MTGYEFCANMQRASPVGLEGYTCRRHGPNKTNTRRAPSPWPLIAEHTLLNIQGFSPSRYNSLSKGYGYEYSYWALGMQVRMLKHRLHCLLITVCNTVERASALSTSMCAYTQTCMRTYKQTDGLDRQDKQAGKQIDRQAG